ncbi:uncharacterized protein PFLUO_LOCUS41 [Penicillium psychrofluorescens]|uniref:uncharacterized protein n=1 Tax=Penicillium psychrofluorescens TaxID=3158075 RepID=UPI003CCD6B64
MRPLSFTIATALAWACAVSSTAILLPLYIWPSGDVWDPVYDAIASHPNIPFYVIINPSSGPGDTEYPASDYITGVAKLNSFDNVRVLGYIPTGYTARNMSEVRSYIFKYGKWSSYTASNISISGIFFDEAPNENDPAKIAYMRKAANYVKSSQFATSDNAPKTVVFNPGTIAAPGYLDSATFVVQYEGTYANWESQNPLKSLPLSQRNQTAAILNETPLTARFTNTARSMHTMGLGAMYMASGCCYKNDNTVEKVADAMAEA